MPCSEPVLHLIIYLLYVCVCVVEHMCHDAHVEVRWQLTGADLLFHYVSSVDGTQAVRHSGNLLYLWSHLTGPKTHLQFNRQAVV